MKTLLISTSILFLSTFCFSQQQLNKGIDQTLPAVPINSSVAQKNIPVTGSEDVVHGNKIYVGTKAVEAKTSSTSSGGDLNSQKSHIGEKAREVQSSEISHAIDPAMKNSHVGSRVEQK